MSKFQLKWPGGCFSKVPKLFGRISGDVILFVSQNETLQLFLFLFLLQHMKRPALQNRQVALLRMAFRARNVLGTFEKQGPGYPRSFAPKLFYSLADGDKSFIAPALIQEWKRVTHFRKREYTIQFPFD